MSRSRDLSSSSSTDSDDDFQLQKQKKSILERPASDLKKATTALSTSDDEDERPTPVKQPLKSASSTSIASKIKNIFRSSKQDKKKPTRKSPAKSDTETEESRSIERSIKNVLKSQTSVVTKPSELDRPSTRLDINSTSSTTTTSETDRSLDSDRTEKDGVSTDNDSPSRLTKKASSGSSSSDDGSDTEREQQAVPIRVKIEKKPPIDKSKWKLDRPDSDSATSDSTQRSVEKTKGNRKERSRFLGRTFDLNSDDSASSGNEMTDVSPLATPKETGKLSMNVFYKALETDELRVDSYGNKMAKRNSAAKSGPGCLQKSRSCDNDYEYKSNCHNSIDFESFGFKMRPGDTSASKRGYNKLLDQSLVNSPYTKVQRPFRVTSSALNRQREQQRIERENQVILKRLLQVKASKHVVKEEQLRDYEKNFGLTSMGFSKLTPLVMMESRGCTPSQSRMSTKRASYRSTANNSRCSSAKSNVYRESHFSSVSQASIDPNEELRRAASASRRRPQWNEKW